MVNGTNITTGPIAGSEASGGGKIMDVQTGVNNELAEVEGFEECDRVWYGEKVLGWWILEEDVETFPNLFKTMETGIINGKKKVGGSQGGGK